MADDFFGLFGEEQLDDFLVQIKKCRGLDLSLYRRTFLLRRLRIRLNEVKIDNLADYAQYLRKDDSEWKKFLDNLSINVSEFFRDPAVFAHFKEFCIPEILWKKKRAGEKNIKCWSCGCSCGEETYSLALMFKDFLALNADKFCVKILGTDVDQEALTTARMGKYSLNSLRFLSSSLREKYFIKDSAVQYIINDTIKSMVLFERHNLVVDPPVKNMDVIFFRNVRIYFSGEKADEVFNNLCSSLHQGGFLVIGKAESLGVRFKELFEPVSLYQKIFRKI